MLNAETRRTRMKRGGDKCFSAKSLPSPCLRVEGKTPLHHAAPLARADRLPGVALRVLRDMRQQLNAEPKIAEITRSNFSEAFSASSQRPPCLRVEREAHAER